MIVMRQRLILFMGITALFLLIIWGRVFYLQIPLRDFFVKKSAQNFTRFQTILPLRGNIRDCNGVLLATNRPLITLAWQGLGKTFGDAELDLIHALEEISNQKLSPTALVQLARAEKYKLQLPIFHDIPQKVLIKIEEQFSDDPHIILQTSFCRHYPYQKLAAHVLGYINSIDEQYVGRMGLESLLQNQLEGALGKRLLIINSVGTRLEQQDICQPLMGQEVWTTINISLQSLAEKIFPGDFVGALLVMDPRTGALRSVLSRPSFDPAMFIKKSQEKGSEFESRYSFLNRAFAACYPPASLFKLISTSAALELGLIREDDTMTCRGFTRFCGRRYHCANRYGHGVLNVREALAKSCNILFYDIGKRLHIDALAEYARHFGLGSKTGIIFPEKEGLVPTSAWKRAVKHEPWWAGETLSCAIGQSYLLATPLQMARMMGAIFEGMLVRPRLLEHEPTTYTPFMIKLSTRAFLQESMKLAVDEGTSKLVSKLQNAGMHIYGKTGTAETSTNKQTVPHSWYVVHFQYKAEPLVLVIVVEHVGAAHIAAKIAKNFLIGYKDLMDQA